jgi:hypothetical protein
MDWIDLDVEWLDMEVEPLLKHAMANWAETFGAGLSRGKMVTSADCSVKVQFRYGAFDLSIHDFDFHADAKSA